jgi:hypothetical protein
MALMPNTIKTVAKTLTAIQREGDWEKLEVAMLCRELLEGCIGSVVGQYLCAPFFKDL